MAKKRRHPIIDLMLKGHRAGVKKAIDDSERTGVPLVVEKNGKIIKIKPKYKYVRVPVKKSSKLN